MLIIIKLLNKNVVFLHFLLYNVYSSKKGVLITKIDVVKNEEWKTWTRTFGWALNGYYEKGNSKISRER